MPLINETDLWSLAKRALAPADRPDERPPPGGPSARDTSRTSPTSRSMPLHDVLTARRSVRRFREDPVPDTDLATLLELATSTDRQMWPHGTAATTPQAWLVSGVPGTSGARLRQYISRRSTAGQTTAGEFTDHGDSPEPALLATRYAPAPVTILICAKITDDTDTDTDTDDTGSDYGRALLRASAFGYNAWLSAVAAGLGGSVYGRSSPEVTRVVRRYTGTPARHLFTLVLGHPAEATQVAGP
ncbi:nitroreductase family protein [Streptomyces sp. NPDC098077]|uniref:nitroreductase family protein n=1 Tax=Streptomyces sp. NPDC098077 TaxID=3366093 RepID=UPI00380795E9